MKLGRWCDKHLGGGDLKTEATFLVLIALRLCLHRVLGDIFVYPITVGEHLVQVWNVLRLSTFDHFLKHYITLMHVWLNVQTATKGHFLSTFSLHT